MYKYKATEISEITGIDVSEITGITLNLIEENKIIMQLLASWKGE